MHVFLSSYLFWLGLASLACLTAERILPWRPAQKLLRPQWSQDLFWLIFNGYFAGLIFIHLFKLTDGGGALLFHRISGQIPDGLALIATRPLWMQILTFLVVADFLEWVVHNALHRIKWLWWFHRVHHSIVTMDWIGNFRFHWFEILIYRLVKYLPLAILGARWEVILAVAVISTTIGHLNHSNLNISWGPLRYIVNSPRMHIWHHDKILRGRAGKNFAVVFSFWDWIFGTAYMPKERGMPRTLGYRGMERVPEGILSRFFMPWFSRPR